MIDQNDLNQLAKIYNTLMTLEVKGQNVITLAEILKELKKEIMIFQQIKNSEQTQEQENNKEIKE